MVRARTEHCMAQFIRKLKRIFVLKLESSEMDGFERF